MAAFLYRSAEELRLRARISGDSELLDNFGVVLYSNGEWSNAPILRPLYRVGVSPLIFWACVKRIVGTISKALGLFNSSVLRFSWTIEEVIESYFD